ncbi:MAG TPA: hypothetical protein VGE07_07015 [Herpetosiphonaceae bacterium]
MKRTITLRVRGDIVDITCPQINYATTVSNCMIVDATDDTIIDTGRTWDAFGRHQQAANPTWRAVVPFAVPAVDHAWIPHFIIYYQVEIEETHRPSRWWHLPRWERDELRLEWPDYDRLPHSDQETISANLRWLQLRRINGRPPLPARRTLRRTVDEVGLLVLLLVLVWTIVVALLR